MYFKTKISSETGEKFTKLIAKKEIAISAQKEVANKYGFESYRGAFWQVWGGFSSCMDFNEEPDPKLWKIIKHRRRTEYFPKKNSKEAKAIWREINEVPCVSILDLNECIGLVGDPFKSIGFSYNNSEYFGFTVGDSWGVEVPDDCEEILSSEYDELFKK